MKTFKATAVAALAIASLALASCSSDSEDNGAADTSKTTTTAASKEVSPVEDLPTPEQLQDILKKAVAPGVPTEEKVNTVVNGEQAPELFDALTKSSQESGAVLEVVAPVLEGVLPDMAEATINLVVPDRDPQVISGVEFVNEGGTWKLDASWACTLVETVLPEQVPPMCNEL